MLHGRRGFLRTDGAVCEEHCVALDVVATVRVSAKATYDVSTRTHSCHIVIEAVSRIGVGIARVGSKARIRACFNRRMVRCATRVTI